MAARHAAGDLLGHQGTGRALPADARRSRRARVRGAGRALLAGVRRAAASGASACCDVASHQRRCRASANALAHDEILDDRAHGGAAGARSRRRRDPRAACAYHALTYGWLCGELVRRVDGRSVGPLLRRRGRRAAGARDLDRPAGGPRAAGLTARLRAGLGQRRRMGAGGDRRRRAAEPRAEQPAAVPAREHPVEPAAWHRAEIPGAGGHRRARELCARLYACLARRRRARRHPPPERRHARAGPPRLTRRWDPLARAHQAFGFGFELQTDPRSRSAPRRTPLATAAPAARPLRVAVVARRHVLRHEPDARRRGGRPACEDAARAAHA